ncbi:hypothetical protein ACFLXC_05640 [Chloroflexota bacterium]
MRLIKAIHKQEHGQVLILLVLIIFVCSIVVIVPLLNFMTTGLVTVKNQGLNIQEIYAAEAGVHDAFWKIKYVVSGVPKETSDPPLEYEIEGGVNGKSVSVTISYIDSDTYRVHSVATNPGTGHQRTIDSDLNASGGGLDLSNFTDKALTSPGTITTKTSDVINGDIWTGTSYDGNANLDGSCTVAPVTGWPTAQQLETYFGYQVNKSSPYSNGTITVTTPSQSGPLYAYTASNPTRTYTLTGGGLLTGTLYIDGSLNFDNAANINLDGHTIFVTGAVTNSPQTKINGPGAIIAISDITFSPQVSGSYLFIMSVEGQVDFQPQGDFYGSVAGDTNINLQPNCTLNWVNPGVAELDMPGHFNNISGIKTWTIR